MNGMNFVFIHEFHFFFPSSKCIPSNYSFRHKIKCQSKGKTKKHLTAHFQISPSQYNGHVEEHSISIISLACLMGSLWQPALKFIEREGSANIHKLFIIIAFPLHLAMVCSDGVAFKAKPETRTKYIGQYYVFCLCCFALLENTVLILF